MTEVPRVHAFRDLSNQISAMDLNIKREIPAPGTRPLASEALGPARGSFSLRLSSHSQSSARSSMERLPSGTVSPQADRRRRGDPVYCTTYANDIIENLAEQEKRYARDGAYLSRQPEINEKMRTILIDWMVDVHLKFKLHPETFYLAVDLVDRYLSHAKGQRSTLQLVGVTSILLAAKYEEIWPPEVRDCVHISANTYTREEIVTMERSIVAALQFRLTTPTSYPFLTRLLEVSDADSATSSLALFFLEHAAMDYRTLSYHFSHVANACVYLANVVMRREWSPTLQYYSKAQVSDFRTCAQGLLDFANNVKAAGQFQAIRRKYSNPRFGEVALLPLPMELP